MLKKCIVYITCPIRLISKHVSRTLKSVIDFNAIFNMFLIPFEHNQLAQEIVLFVNYSQCEICQDNLQRFGNGQDKLQFTFMKMWDGQLKFLMTRLVQSYDQPYISCNLYWTVILLTFLMHILFFFLTSLYSVKESCQQSKTDWLSMVFSY